MKVFFAVVSSKKLFGFLCGIFRSKIYFRFPFELCFSFQFSTYSEEYFFFFDNMKVNFFIPSECGKSKKKKRDLYIIIFVKKGKQKKVRTDIPTLNGQSPPTLLHPPPQLPVCKKQSQPVSFRTWFLLELMPPSSTNTSPPPFASFLPCTNAAFVYYKVV